MFGVSWVQKGWEPLLFSLAHKQSILSISDKLLITKEIKLLQCWIKWLLIKSLIPACIELK